MTDTTISESVKILLKEATWTECARQADDGSKRFSAVFPATQNARILISATAALQDYGVTVSASGDGTEIVMTQGQMESLGIRNRNDKLPPARDTTVSHAERLADDRASSTFRSPG